MTINPFKQEPNETRAALNRIGLRVRNLERRINAGGATEDRFVHQSTLSVADATSGPKQTTIVWGPPSGGFDFEHGEPFVDFSSPTSPVVLMDGIYAITVWVSETAPGISYPGDWAQIAVDVDTGGDDNDFVQALDLGAPTGFRNATLAVTYFIPAGSGFDGIVRHDHAGTALTYAYVVQVQHVA